MVARKSAIFFILLLLAGRIGVSPAAITASVVVTDKRLLKTISRPFLIFFFCKGLIVKND